MEKPKNSYNKSYSSIKELINNICDDIFFIQERAWKGWVIFNVYKIRTMRKGDELNIPNDTMKWNKNLNDSRIIENRKWMRQTGFDEIPQILNIIKWEMSFFGSRPSSIPIYNNLEDREKERRDKYNPWIFWWYAFYDKWKNSKKRTLRNNQDIYIKLRSINEKKGKINMFKFNFFILIENFKFLLKWNNR